jgi:hypothetical protein
MARAATLSCPHLGGTQSFAAGTVISSGGFPPARNEPPMVFEGVVSFGKNCRAERVECVERCGPGGIGARGVRDGGRKGYAGTCKIFLLQ